MGDPGHGVVEQVARPGTGRLPEAQRVEHGDRARADREHVAQDPTDAGRRSLERLDLQAALEATEATVDLEALEKEFVNAAATYSERKGISYSAWRELGVPGSVLERAGITRSS